MMTDDEYLAALRRHLDGFFTGHESSVQTFYKGPVQSVVPAFQVLEVAPGPKNLELWTYVSMGPGLIAPKDGPQLELILITHFQSRRHVEIIAKAAHHHLTEEPLDFGTVMPLGEPWREDSRLDHLFVSPPYTLGREVADFRSEPGDVQLAWIVPISQTERDFVVNRGVEAFEEEMETKQIPYWHPLRPPIVLARVGPPSSPIAAPYRRVAALAGRLAEGEWC